MCACWRLGCTAWFGGVGAAFCAGICCGNPPWYSLTGATVAGVCMTLNAGDGVTAGINPCCCICCGGGYIPVLGKMACT